MILNFSYNDDNAPSRVRQYDLLRATVGRPEEADFQLSAILAKEPTALMLKGAVVPTVLASSTTEVQAMEPDLALAAGNQVRSPLELLVLQNTLQLLSGGVAVIADLVEFEVSPQKFSVWERSLPLYRVRGAALGLSLTTASRLTEVIRSGRSNVIDPQARSAIERYYFGPRLHDLEVELLHLSRHPLNSKWTTPTASLLAQLGEPLTSAFYSGSKIQLTDNLTGGKVTLELDSITGALIITECDYLSSGLASALIDEAERTQTAVIYFSERVAAATELGLARTEKVHLGIETTAEWPAFRRLGLAPPVHFARLKEALVHRSPGPSQGQRA